MNVREDDGVDVQDDVRIDFYHKPNVVQNKVGGCFICTIRLMVPGVYTFTNHNKANFSDYFLEENSMESSENTIYSYGLIICQHKI